MGIVFSVNLRGDCDEYFLNDYVDSDNWGRIIRGGLVCVLIKNTL